MGQAAQGLHSVAFFDLAGYVLGGGPETVAPVILDELETLLAAGAVVVDVREPEEDNPTRSRTASTFRTASPARRPRGCRDRLLVTVETGPRAAIAASILRAEGLDAARHLRRHRHGRSPRTQPGVAHPQPVDLRQACGCATSARTGPPGRTVPWASSRSELISSRAAYRRGFASIVRALIDSRMSAAAPGSPSAASLAASVQGTIDPQQLVGYRFGHELAHATTAATIACPPPNQDASMRNESRYSTRHALAFVVPCRAEQSCHLREHRSQDLQVSMPERARDLVDGPRDQLTGSLEDDLRLDQSQERVEVVHRAALVRPPRSTRASWSASSQSPRSKWSIASSHPSQSAAELVAKALGEREPSRR